MRSRQWLICLSNTPPRAPAGWSFLSPPITLRDRGRRHRICLGNHQEMVQGHLTRRQKNEWKVRESNWNVCEKGKLIACKQVCSEVQAIHARLHQPSKAKQRCRTITYLLWHREVREKLQVPQEHSRSRLGISGSSFSWEFDLFCGNSWKLIREVRAKMIG